MTTLATPLGENNSESRPPSPSGAAMLRMSSHSDAKKADATRSKRSQSLGRSWLSASSNLWVETSMLGTGVDRLANAAYRQALRLHRGTCRLLAQKGNAVVYLTMAVWRQCGHNGFMSTRPSA